MRGRLKINYVIQIYRALYTLKDEQIECFHGIVCHGRYVLAVLPTGFCKSAIYQKKVIGITADQPLFLLTYKEERYLYQVTR